MEPNASPPLDSYPATPPPGAYPVTLPAPAAGMVAADSSPDPKLPANVRAALALRGLRNADLQRATANLKQTLSAAVSRQCHQTRCEPQREQGQLQAENQPQPQLHPQSQSELEPQDGGGETGLSFRVTGLTTDHILSVIIPMAIAVVLVLFAVIAAWYFAIQDTKTGRAGQGQGPVRRGGCTGVMTMTLDSAQTRDYLEARIRRWGVRGGGGGHSP